MKTWAPKNNSARPRAKLETHNEAADTCGFGVLVYQVGSLSWGGEGTLGGGGEEEASLGLVVHGGGTHTESNNRRLAARTKWH